MSARLAALAVLVCSGAASAAPFSVTITNTATNNNYDFSQGLITLQPLINIGLTPRPGTQQYATYAFANSNCNVTDSFCSGSCSDNGNATVLAQRWGLTLGVNAWLVPALAANGGTTTVNINAPAGSRLSYIAWINDTGVFDDFVSMNEVGAPTTLSAPLFDASGNPLANIAYELHGYDMNAVNPNDGNSGTCTPECPTATTGCYVSLGNASTGSTGYYAPGPPTSVRQLVALSGNNRNTLTWTNPAPSYGVVVVRKSGSVVNRNPTNGNAYAVGANLGQQNTVVYVGTGTNSFTDTYGPPANATTYFYKVYARNSANQYAGGDVPGTAGISSKPTNGVSPNPRWCYTFTYASTMQPVLALASGVFHASNSGGVIALNPDGTERFRPVAFAAPVQGRFLALPMQGRSGTWLIAADQAGNVALIDGANGSVAWTRNVATNIQAQPSAQLFVASNAAFQARYPGRDVIFIASRNSSTTSNTVTALSSVDGSIQWQYAPGNLDIISGGMLLDRATNRLWVASRAGGGNPSLRVLNTVTTNPAGSVLASFSNVGDVDLPISWGYTANEAIVTATNGAVRAYDLNTMALSWTHSPGTQNAFAFPTGDGYIASLSSGQVQRYTVNPTTKAVTVMWSPPATVASPTGVRIDYTTQKVYVGNGAGVLTQINVADGGVEKTVTATNTGLGIPNIDPNLTPKRLYVSGLDGRLCAFDVPF